MKRVHNDHGSAGGSPPSGAAQTTKGRKRKTEVAETQAPSSRKAAVKSMPAPKEIKDTTQPLVDLWMSHHKAVEGMFRGLVKPDDMQNIQNITSMQERLDAMMKLTKAFGATNNTLVGTG